MRGMILEQTVEVMFVVHTQQCDFCTRQQTEHTWKASVQVRQRVEHKRTFLWLEQLILKHNANSQTISISEKPDGLDFYFGHKSHAAKFVDFLDHMVPIKYETPSKKLISADLKSNTQNYKYTYYVEIVAVCKDDLVCLPKKLARSMGQISQLCVATKVANLVHFIDPNTLQTAEMTPRGYWTHQFVSLGNSTDLVEFEVLDIEYSREYNGKFQLADAEVIRVNDYESTFITRTHLGNLLKPGDSVLGYDLTASNFNDDNFDNLKFAVPDVILVKKIYPNRRSKKHRRHWKLKTLEKDDQDMQERDVIKKENDTEVFMRELEEDPEMRSQLNLYRDENYVELDDALEQGLIEEVDEFDAPEEDFPEVQLDELLDDLTLEETEVEYPDNPKDFRVLEDIDEQDQQDLYDDNGDDNNNDEEYFEEDDQHYDDDDEEYYESSNSGARNWVRGDGNGGMDIE
eukprot:TRINITY_DN11341_c0_g1_i12.p1 TRINITY_DN11341_c0_g1~~TRINITY_DN11341_c0_g1_i12.p1  ORF type:complete len:458 (+),score=156.84 TRINITY_DN11341_c0_g1_i12:139-1512(+)